MMQTYVGFIDVGFLRAAGAAVLGQRAASVNPNSNAVANWFRSIGATPQLSGQTLLRAYWYDGAFDPAHPNYAGQRTFFNAIARTPGIQLRLGQIAERPNRFEDPIKQALANTAQDLGMAPSQLLAAFSQRWTFRPERQQKGVDTLIALDMVRLASRSAYTTAVLIAGDRDLAEAIRTAQDFGARVLLASPSQQSVAQEVAQLADDLIDIAEADLRLMLPLRSARNARNNA